MILQSMADIIFLDNRRNYAFKNDLSTEKLEKLEFCHIDVNQWNNYEKLELYDDTRNSYSFLRFNVAVLLYWYI